jgi:RNA polymerase sigma-70 factor (ECF subfamily)
MVKSSLMEQDDAERQGAGEPRDREIIESVLAGHREDYRILVRRYQDVLFRHAVRMTGEGDVAADLVQASLIRAYSSIGHCRDRDRFGAWLFRILTNACKDHLKSRRRKDVRIDDAAIRLSSTSSPEADLERTETRSRVATALEKLPATLREAFVLKHVEGLPYEEIATIMNTSVPALKMRVHRARELLKGLLANKDE